MAASLKPNPPFHHVAAQLRRRIVAGQWAPGAQLPTWDLMAKEFSVARPTLMRAMDLLRRDGFVFSKSTRGTFVSEKPPHLSRFGLVFASHPGAGGERFWNLFWGTLAAQAAIVERAAGLQLPIFHDAADPASDGRRQLLEQAADHCLGGLILVGTKELMESKTIAALDLPKAAIFNAPTDPPMPRVYIDRASFIEQSLDRLVALGRRRVAVLSNQSDRWQDYEPAFAARDLQSKPFWHLAASPSAAANVVRLLFDPDNAVTPDGLVIADDNIVEQALAGLLQSGVRVPEQLEIVAHCNWPAPVPLPVPIHRLGYDVRELLQACVDLLREPHRQPRGITTNIPARWELAPTTD